MRDTHMKKSLGRGTAFLPLGFFSLFLSAYGQLAVHPESTETVYESARTCRTCHESLYKAWSEGAHAKTWENILYHAARSAYMSASAELGSVHCDGCHAPISHMTGDFHLLDPESREGITCDVCHTLASSAVGNGRPVSSGERVKSGPTGDCPSGFHDCRKEEALGHARLCGVCHQYRNRSGVSLYTEYEEWTQIRESRGGQSCCDCHFSAAAEDSAPGASHLLIPLEGEGGLLEKALAVEARLERKDEVIVSVSVTNAGAAHAVPGGPPLRSVILEVRGYDTFGFEVYRDASVVFARRVNGPRSPATGLEIPWLAWETVTDERIGAGEKKSYSFSTGRSDIVKARVSLLYKRYSLREYTEETILPESSSSVMTSIEVGQE